MNYTQEQIKLIIDEIERLGYKPNEWEEQFLEDIEGKFSLTDKQSEALYRIYSKASGQGQYVTKQRFRR